MHYSWRLLSNLADLVKYVDPKLLAAVNNDKTKNKNMKEEKDWSYPLEGILLSPCLLSPSQAGNISYLMDQIISPTSHKKRPASSGPSHVFLVLTFLFMTIINVPEKMQLYHKNWVTKQASFLFSRGEREERKNVTR